MLAGPAVVLIAAVRLQGEEAKLDALEQTIVDSPLGDRAVAATKEAPYLCREQKERIETGFQQLGARKWTVACDLLLKALEGALWDTAAGLGVIDKERYLTGRERRRFARTANSLLAEEDGLADLRPSFRRYLDDGVFNAKGNDLRHGRAGNDARAHALLAAVAIFGWLDRYSDTELMVELGERLGDYADGLDLGSFTNPKADDLASGP